MTVRLTPALKSKINELWKKQVTETETEGLDEVRKQSVIIVDIIAEYADSYNYDDDYEDYN